MQKQTLFISQSAHLSLKQAQLIIYLKKTQQTEQRPIEDLAFVVLEHREITLTQQVLAYLGRERISRLLIWRLLFVHRNHTSTYNPASSLPCFKKTSYIYR